MSLENTAPNTEISTESSDGGGAIMSDLLSAVQAKVAGSTESTEKPENIVDNEQKTEEIQEKVNQKEEKPDEIMAKSWQEVVKRDREVVEKQQHLKQQQQKLAQLDQIMDAAKKNPVALLESLGVDRNTLLDAWISQEAGGQKPQPANKEPNLLDELKNLQSKFDNFKAEMVETNKIRQLMAIDDNPNTLLKKAAKDNETEVLNDILSEAAQIYSETGQRPNYAEAMDRVEKKYERHIFNLIDWAKDDIKVNKRYNFTSGGLDKHTTPNNNTNGEPKQPKTLTNDLQGVAPRENTRPQTQEEKRKAFLEIISKTNIGE